MKSKSIFTILILFLGAKLAWSQAELGTGESSTPRNLKNFQQLKEQKSAYLNDEYSKLPGIMKVYFDSSDCRLSGAGGATLPNIENDFRAKPNYDYSGGLVCKTQQSGDLSEKSFKLCTAESVTCSNSSLGGIQKRNLTFIVAQGEECHNANAKKAFLNSLEATKLRGGIDVW